MMPEYGYMTKDGKFLEKNTFYFVDGNIGFKLTDDIDNAHKEVSLSNLRGIKKRHTELDVFDIVKFKWVVDTVIGD